MRIPALAIVFIVSCAFFLWHGFDKIQILGKFHQQALSLTVKHSIQAIESGLESLRRRADAFAPTDTAIISAMKIHFPLAENFSVGDPTDAEVGLFGSIDALHRCDQSPVSPGSTRTTLCFSE